MCRRTGIVGLLLLALACASPAPTPSAEPPEPAPTPAPAESPAAGAGGAESAKAPEAPAQAPSQEPAAEPPVELPPLSDRERDLGHTFQPLADEFALTEYVAASRTASGRGLVFEYLPQGQTLDDWEYHGTFVLTRVGDTWEQGLEVMPRFIEIFIGQQDQVNEAGTWNFPEGDVTFLDSEDSEGGVRVHSLSAIWQVLPGHIAIFQAQRRPERFEEWQIVRFKQVASRLGRADAGGEEAPPQEGAPAPEDGAR